jgi:hypothetical protein
LSQGGSFATVARALAAEVRAAKARAPASRSRITTAHRRCAQSVRPLFRGLGPALAGSSLHFCVLMLLYEPLRDGARSRWGHALPRFAPDAAAGALAGAAVRTRHRMHRFRLLPLSLPLSLLLRQRL